MNEVRKRGFGLLVVPALLVALAGATPNEPQLSVMTRNLYIGGDLLPVATAPDLDSFMAAARALLTDIAISNLPERAQSLAREIEERRPDVIGLQEVSNLRLNFQNGPLPFVDYLAETLDALAALGLDYVVAASVQNVDLTVPVDLDEDGLFEWVSLTDRDVILVRADLVEAGAVLPVPLSSVCLRPSADGGPGCNYSTFVTIDLLFGSFIYERGFVGVDVTMNGTVHRVINTHLEVEDLDPTNPLSPLIQSAQATELKAVVDPISAGVALLVIGDLNSTPDDPLFPDPLEGPFVRPYQQLAEGVDLVGLSTPAPYFDTWLLRPGSPAGYTCCDPNLIGVTFNVSDRRDLVFSRSVPASAKANVFGNDPEDKTASGLWPSDHAGVFVRLWF
jgi:hypothetical protein